MQASVEKPPISGSLYNCALNCALPSIFQISRTFSQSNLPQLPQFKAYVDLKNCFQQWYQLPELSWEVFNAIISNHTHSENELLFAPVIRQFIAKQAGLIIAQQEAEEAQRARDQGKEPIRHGNFGYIETLRDIVDDPLARYDDEQIMAEGVAYILERARADELARLEAFDREDTPHAEKMEFYRSVLKANPLNRGAGRYYALTSAEANNYFYKPFGFHMHVLQFRVRHEGVDVYAATGAGQDNSIHVYLKNNHYELQQHHLSHGIELDARYTKRVFQTAFASVGGAKFSTNQQLAEILTYVQEHCYPQVLREHPAPPPHAPHPELSREHYHLEYFRIATEHTLHNTNRDGRLTFAVILLTLMENSSLTKGSPASLTLIELSTCTDQARIEAIIDETFGLCAGIAHPETSPPASVPEIVNPETPARIGVGSGQNVNNHYANPNSFWNSSLVRSTCLALLIADVVTNVVAAFVGGTLSAFLFSPPGIILSAIIAAVSLLVLYQKTTEPSAPSLNA